jgi:hypothetical protein
MSSGTTIAHPLGAEHQTPAKELPMKLAEALLLRADIQKKIVNREF